VKEKCLNIQISANLSSANLDLHSVFEALLLKMPLEKLLIACQLQQHVPTEEGERVKTVLLT